MTSMDACKLAVDTIHLSKPYLPRSNKGVREQMENLITPKQWQSFAYSRVPYRVAMSPQSSSSLTHKKSVRARR